MRNITILTCTLIAGLTPMTQSFAQDASAPAAPQYEIDGDFRKVVLDADREVDGKLAETLKDPMELAVAPDGRVFTAERAGVVKMWKPDTKTTVIIASINVFGGLEEGMLGITLDPNFARNNWVYLNHSLPETTHDGRGKSGIIRISRYTLKGEALDLASEKKIFDIPVQREQCCHVGGSLAFDAKGNLHISVGDNTNPFDSDGYSPNDPRPGRYPWDAQGSSANANSLTGKILRIKPKADGGYEIPEGNLFKPGTPGTRPEIYVMGNRNPFRISIDPKTGFLYWGEVGPDAGQPDEKRGGAGHDEINQAKGPGFFGWPYFVANNKPYAPVDYVARQKHMDAKAAREKAKKEGKPESEWPPKEEPWMSSDFTPAFYNPGRPINDSPNNTGIKELPPAQPALIYYPASPSTRFPMLRSGGRTAMAGPVYYFDPKLQSPHKLPAEFDSTLFIYEWTRNWIMAVKLDAAGKVLKIEPFLKGMTFKRPMDMELGPDGCLYIIEFGANWGNNVDSKIIRIEYAPTRAASQ